MKRYPERSSCLTASVYLPWEVEVSVKSKWTYQYNNHMIRLYVKVDMCIWWILTEALMSSESRVARSRISSTRRRRPRTWTSRASGEWVCWISFSIMFSSDDIVSPVVAGIISVPGLLVLLWPASCWACWDLISDSILALVASDWCEFWLVCVALLCDGKVSLKYWFFPLVTVGNWESTSLLLEQLN